MAAVIVALLSFSFFFPLSIILALVRGPVSLHSLRSLSLTSQPAVAKKKKKKGTEHVDVVVFVVF